MKFNAFNPATGAYTSPSTRREWIEINIEKIAGKMCQSPSTRREWIEIADTWEPVSNGNVSLHTEGVD